MPKSEGMSVGQVMAMTRTAAGLAILLFFLALAPAMAQQQPDQKATFRTRPQPPNRPLPRRLSSRLPRRAQTQPTHQTRLRRLRHRILATHHRDRRLQ